MTHGSLGIANGGLELLKNVVEAAKTQSEKRALVLAVGRGVNPEDKERFCQMVS